MQINLTPKQLEALRHIRNSIAHGQNPSVRDIQRALYYKSPRSAALIIDSLIGEKIIRRKPDGNLQLLRDIDSRLDHAQTVEVPLIGVVACGTPILAEENLEAMIPVSKNLVKPNSHYFLLRASGDSMDEVGISDGNLVLVRQQPTAEEGEKVIALIDNEATVKEFHRSGNAVILKPRSKNKSHQPIILTEDFQVQGVVVATLPKF